MGLPPIPVRKQFLNCLKITVITLIILTRILPPSSIKDCHERQKMIVIRLSLTSVGGRRECLGDAHPKLRMFFMDLPLRIGGGGCPQNVGKYHRSSSHRSQLLPLFAAAVLPTVRETVTDGVSVCEASPAASVQRHSRFVSL